MWYTGQFYVNSWLKTALKINYNDRRYRDSDRAGARHAVFVVFGGLSDRIGRKKIMMAGNLIAAICSIRSS